MKTIVKTLFIVSALTISRPIYSASEVDIEAFIQESRQDLSYLFTLQHLDQMIKRGGNTSDDVKNWSAVNESRLNSYFSEHKMTLPDDRKLWMEYLEVIKVKMASDKVIQDDEVTTDIYGDVWKYLRKVASEKWQSYLAKSKSD